MAGAAKEGGKVYDNFPARLKTVENTQSDLYSLSLPSGNDLKIVFEAIDTS